MQSRPLKQAINLALDTLGMQGPVTRRQVAEKVLRETTQDHWAVGDEREAKIAYLMTGVAEAMNEPHGNHIVEQYMFRVPEEYRAVLRGLPRFICVSPRGGRASEHVMTILATPEQWAANFELKDRIVEATTISRDESRAILLLLKSTGARSLSELLRVEAAE